MKEDVLRSSVTLRDIAKSLGISHVTVSLALRDAAKIPLDRRKQIQEKARMMGYRPNPMAAALGSLRFTTKARPINAELAWIQYQENSQNIRRFKEFDLYWRGAKETAQWFGYNLEEFICNDDFDLSRLEKVLLARGVHGILIPPHGKLPPNWDSFGWNFFSVVRFGYTISRPQVHLVTSDQINNTLLAFAKIQARGYKRIGYVSGGTNAMHFGGVLIAESKLKAKDRIEPLVVSPSANTPAEAKKLSVDKKTRPDAILTDVAALRGMLKAEGHRVPDDIGLAVCSVLDGNADSGIYQNPEEIGKAAVEMLISLIAHNHTGIPKFCRKMLIEGEWVDGTSLPIRA